MSHQTNGGAGVLVYKSDSEFTDQSDAPQQTSAAAIRQRYFSTQQQHTNHNQQLSAAGNHTQHLPPHTQHQHAPPQIATSINPQTNSLPLNSQMTSSIPNHHPLQQQNPQQQQQLLPVQGDTRLKNRGAAASLVSPQINNAANIHPNIAEHG